MLQFSFDSFPNFWLASSLFLTSLFLMYVILKTWLLNFQVNATAKKIIHFCTYIVLFIFIILASHRLSLSLIYIYMYIYIMPAVVSSPHPGERIPLNPIIS